MADVKLRFLSKKFGGIYAVNHINMDIPDGKIIVFLGPSGCGKTTTLKMIAGLNTPTEGDILFNGRSVINIPTEKRNIGMVFQRYLLFPHMNVAQNVGFGLKIRNTDPIKIKEKVKEALKIVHLSGFERKFPTQLSGGEQQRVAIARALVINTSLLLMDEPLANLDSKLRIEMRSFILSLQRRLKITTIFVTHDQSEAITLADKIAVMFNGKVIQFDEPKTLFNHPISPEVADFLGATNILKGIVKSCQKNKCLIESELGETGVSQSIDFENGREVFFTIRPEHININSDKESKAKNTYIGKIKEVVYEGGSVRYYLNFGKNIVQVCDRSNKVLSREKYVSIYFDPEKVWIFPKNRKIM